MKFKIKEALNEATLKDLVDADFDSSKDKDIEAAREAKRQARLDLEKENRQKHGKLTAMERYQKQREEEERAKAAAKGVITPEEQAILDKYAEPEDEVAYYDGDIERALDDILVSALNQKWKEQHNAENGTALKTEFPCLWLVGEAGTGKTTRVKAWCEANGIDMVERSLSTLDETDLGGAVAADLQQGKARRLSSDEFDDLDESLCVLFLDEYLRGRAPVRQTLLNLINHHIVPNKDHKGGMKYYPNLLFVVGATNPKSDAYNIKDDFDSAELTRGEIVSVVGDPKGFLWNYLKMKRDEIRAAVKDHRTKLAQQNMNKITIAETLVNDPRFEFDSAQEIAEILDWEGVDDIKGFDGKYNVPILNSRSLTKLLEDSDGTIHDFLNKWSKYCNPRKKEIVENILDDVDIDNFYDDSDFEVDDDEFDVDEVDDKANSVFKRREKSAADELSDLW